MFERISFPTAEGGKKQNNNKNWKPNKPPPKKTNKNPQTNTPSFLTQATN